MASYNKVILIGNLGSDPDVRFTGSGQAVANLSIATTEKWQTGEKTEWHRIVVFGKQAETCKQYLTKGRQICVEGRLQTRQWEDKDGNKRYTTEIVAQRVVFLGRAPEKGVAPEKEASFETDTDFTPKPEGAVPGFAVDDDIPF